MEFLRAFGPEGSQECMGVSFSQQCHFHFSDNNANANANANSNAFELPQSIFYKVYESRTHRIPRFTRPLEVFAAAWFVTSH
jgi:hypothetical protein